jgi:hypothetical protein
MFPLCACHLITGRPYTEIIVVPSLIVMAHELVMFAHFFFILLKLKETVMSVLKDACSSVSDLWRIKIDQGFHNTVKSPDIVSGIKVC